MKMLKLEYKSIQLKSEWFYFNSLEKETKYSIGMIDLHLFSLIKKEKTNRATKLFMNFVDIFRFIKTSSKSKGEM